MWGWRISYTPPHLLHSSVAQMQFPMSELVPIVPQKLDMVRVLGGEFRSYTGQLLNIEENENEGVVKLFEIDQLKILDMNLLGKYRQPLE